MAPILDRTIVITGASSGIGAALALRFARHPGAVLGLVGRDAGRLAGVAEACRAAGATAEVASLDARDRSGLAAWLRGFDGAHPIDAVVANAGVWAGGLPGGHPERGDQVFDIFDINVGGTLNLVVPALDLMRPRGRGRVVLVSSLSAYAPLPDAAAYSASKAALLVFGLALRQNLKRDGLTANVVVPGFVATPMIDGSRGWKPLEITAAAAAARIERGLARDRRVIAFPRRMALVSRLSGLVPEPALGLAMRLFGQ